MEHLRNARVYMVSLGCAKNRVDSEKTLALLLKRGCTITDNPEDADAVLVNSCGFTNEARAETVDTLLELAEIKKTNPRLKLAAMGCMVELFKGDMASALPEVDMLVGLSDDEFSQAYLSNNLERAIQPGAVTAYVKVAEGCGNSCSFCAIPLIRGPLKSRPVKDIVAESSLLVQQGIKEICLVSQDTTRYGADLRMKDGIVDLLQKVADTGPAWVRLLYLYPTLVSDRLIAALAGGLPVVPYVDVPLQHIDSNVLKRMGRQETEDDIRRLLDKLRTAMPEGAIRSSFITGFPGETDAEFNKLARFLEEGFIDHAGVFTYSPEEGTKAATLKDDVPDDVKEERKSLLMEIQRDVSRRMNERRIGKVSPVLVERYSEEEGLLLGRLPTQAPEVDGEIILDDCTAEPGELVNIKISKALDYDLVGKPV